MTGESTSSLSMVEKAICFSARARREVKLDGMQLRRWLLEPPGTKRALVELGSGAWRLRTSDSPLELESMRMRTKWFS